MGMMGFGVCKALRSLATLSRLYSHRNSPSLVSFLFFPTHIISLSLPVFQADARQASLSI